MSDNQVQKSKEEQQESNVEAESGSMPTIVFVLLGALVAIIAAAVLFN